MKTLNPFVPTVALMVVPKRTSQRERFRRGFFIVLGAHLAFLLVLLVQSYRTDSMSMAGAAEADQAVIAQAATHQEVAPAPPNTLVVRARTPQPTPPPAAVTAPIPTKAPASAEVLHKIRSGDTLLSISKTYGVSVKAIKSANSLSSERLVVGQTLKIPDPRTQVAAVSQG